MPKVILVVTNEPTIAEQYFLKYKENNDITTIEPVITDNIACNIDNAVTAWIEETSISKQLHYINSSVLKSDKLNVIFLPYSGLAYSVLKSRVSNIELDTIVVCINERIPTQAAALNQFNVLLNGKYYPPINFFTEYMTKNGLRSILFDSTINMVKDGLVPFLPEQANILLGQIAND